MTINKVQKTAALLKLLSDPTRLGIVVILLNSRQPVCVNDIATAVSASPSATSHQLAKLEINGLIEGYRQGQTICYTIKDTKLVKKLAKVVALFK